MKSKEKPRNQTGAYFDYRMLALHSFISINAPNR